MRVSMGICVRPHNDVQRDSRRTDTTSGHCTAASALPAASGPHGSCVHEKKEASAKMGRVKAEEERPRAMARGGCSHHRYSPGSSPSTSINDDSSCCRCATACNERLAKATTYTDSKASSCCCSWDPRLEEATGTITVAPIDGGPERAASVASMMPSSFRTRARTST